MIKIPKKEKKQTQSRNIKKITMITRNLFKRLSKFNNKRAFSVARFETLDDSIATIDLEAPLFHVVLVNEEWHPQ